MDTNEFNKIISVIADIDIQNVFNDEFRIKKLNIYNLRDILISLGKIHYEDLENNIYIVSIYGGFFKKNRALVAFHLEEKRIMIAISANEGIIDQHTCREVYYEIRKKLEKFIE